MSPSIANAVVVSPPSPRDSCPLATRRRTAAREGARRVAFTPIGTILVPMGAYAMDGSTERASGILGLTGVAIALGGLPLAPKWPEADAPIDVVRAYFVEHGGA